MDDGTTLFLGDLSVYSTENHIRDLFQNYGKIENIRIKKGNSTKPHLCYGFIKFQTRQSAEKAMTECNGKLFLGRTLRVGWAEKKSQAAPVAAPNKPVTNNKGSKSMETAQIHVSFISKQIDALISESTLRSLFGMYGEVVDVAIKKSQFDKKLKLQNGYGFVHFPLTQQGIQAAINATNAIHQVTIDRVTYDCSLSHSLEVLMNHPEQEQDQSEQDESQQQLSQSQDGNHSSPAPNENNNPPAAPTMTIPTSNPNLSINAQNSSGAMLNNPLANLSGAQPLPGTQLMPPQLTTLQNQPALPALIPNPNLMPNPNLFLPQAPAPDLRDYDQNMDLLAKGFQENFMISSYHPHHPHLTPAGAPVLNPQQANFHHHHNAYLQPTNFPLGMFSYNPNLNPLTADNSAFLNHAGMNGMRTSPDLSMNPMTMAPMNMNPMGMNDGSQFPSFFSYPPQGAATDPFLLSAASAQGTNPAAAPYDPTMHFLFAPSMNEFAPQPHDNGNNGLN